MVKLRGHHLICLHFFKGKGYGKDFIDNISKVIEKARQSEIEIVDGTDDVCGACPYNRDGFCTYSGNADQEVRRLDELAVKLLNVRNTVGWNHLKCRIPEIIEVWKEEACRDCDWNKTCFIE
ncbi:MAG: DUF1284 domain-containing protein [Bacillota bacterium]